MTTSLLCLLSWSASISFTSSARVLVASESPSFPASALRGQMASSSSRNRMQQLSSSAVSLAACRNAFCRFRSLSPGRDPCTLQSTWITEVPHRADTWRTRDFLPQPWGPDSRIPVTWTILAFKTQKCMANQNSISHVQKLKTFHAFTLQWIIKLEEMAEIVKDFPFSRNFIHAFLVSHIN